MNYEYSDFRRVPNNSLLLEARVNQRNWFSEGNETTFCKLTYWADTDVEISINEGTLRMSGQEFELLLELAKRTELLKEMTPR